MTRLDTGLIDDAEQLRAYLDTHPERHPRVEDGTCGCGWPHVPAAMVEQVMANAAFPSQAEHAAAVLLGNLGDLLPSDTSIPGPDGEAPVPLSWRALTQDLYEQIAERERAVDPRAITVMRWALAEGHADVEALARITGMHGRYLARLLSTPAGAAPLAAGSNAPGGDVRPGALYRLYACLIAGGAAVLAYALVLLVVSAEARPLSYVIAGAAGAAAGYLRTRLGLRRRS